MFGAVSAWVDPSHVLIPCACTQVVGCVHSHITSVGFSAACTAHLGHHLLARDLPDEGIAGRHHGRKPDTARIDGSRASLMTALGGVHQNWPTLDAWARYLDPSPVRMMACHGTPRARPPRAQVRRERRNHEQHNRPQHSRWNATALRLGVGCVRLSEVQSEGAHRADADAGRGTDFLLVRANNVWANGVRFDHTPALLLMATSAASKGLAAAQLTGLHNLVCL